MKMLRMGRGTKSCLEEHIEGLFHSSHTLLRPQKRIGRRKKPGRGARFEKGHGKQNGVGTKTGVCGCGLEEKKKRHMKDLESGGNFRR